MERQTDILKLRADNAQSMSPDEILDAREDQDAKLHSRQSIAPGPRGRTPA